MSTFVDIKRISSKTDKTTAIRLDDDLKITVRTEKSGSHTDHQANFTGLQEGQSVDTTDPIAWVQVSKDGDEEVAIIGVNVYHAEDEHDTVPAEGQYWYDPSTHYWPATAAQPGKTLATNPEFKDTVQTFPTVIFNISSAGNLISGNSVSATTISSTELVNYRRSLLKNKLSMKAMDPFLPFIMGGYSLNPIGPASTTVPLSPSADTVVTVQQDLARRQQGFTFWLEMLTRAISVDANLSSDQYFALLDGEISLNSSDVFKEMDRRLAEQIADATPRIGWQFRKFGDVSQANLQSPWIYSSPTSETIDETDQTGWAAEHDANISIGSVVPQAVTDNWLLWLRT